MWGDIPVIQIMKGGATDATPWRNAGIPAYGVSGLMVDPDDLRLHGRDERVPVKSFYDALEFTTRLVKRLTSPRAIQALGTQTPGLPDGPRYWSVPENQGNATRSYAWILEMSTVRSCAARSCAKMSLNRAPHTISS